MYNTQEENENVLEKYGRNINEECKKRNALRPETTRVPDHEIDRMAILANELKPKLENEKYRNKQF